MESLLQLVANEQNLTLIAEGKTKMVFGINSVPDYVLIRSKDQLTAFNAQRKDQLEGKARIANKTTVNVFKLLNEIGISTHFVAEGCAGEFVARRCEMVPVEWVARRVATGSFLKRNRGVQQGYRFSKPKIETFLKDDEKDDPQYSDEQIICAEFQCNGLKIAKSEINVMKRMTSVIFKVLERCWAKHDCILIDMKVEYGVTSNGNIVLADVVDNDSWRVWPHGDRRLQLDKQFYRDMTHVTHEALQQLVSNYEKVMELTADFLIPSYCRALIVMGSSKDLNHCEKIADSCRSLGIRPVLRVSSAHKTTPEALDIVCEYETDGIPTVVIAVAGLSNGLGPVIAGNSHLPVINCPNLTESSMATDIWSSLRMPSGLGCSTVFGAEEAALSAAKILASFDHIVYGRILALQLCNALKISMADAISTQKTAS